MRGHFQKPVINRSATVLDNENVAVDIYRLTLNAPEICKVATPGQFVMLKAGEDGVEDPLLRRPLSIHNIDNTKLQLLYKVVGRGTQILARTKAQDTVNILGPLGVGYQIKQAKCHCLVGGGIGTAPLLFLASKIICQQPGSAVEILLGARTAGELLDLPTFRALNNCHIMIATDDGSKGHHGFVHELMAQIDSDKDVSVYTCGPEPMMKAVANVGADKNWPVQVSMEATMACGMGACLGCAIEGKKGQGEVGYIHVCKDGPVFEAEEIW